MSINSNQLHVAKIYPGNYTNVLRYWHEEKTMQFENANGVQTSYTNQPVGGPVGVVFRPGWIAQQAVGYVDLSYQALGTNNQLAYYTQPYGSGQNTAAQPFLNASVIVPSPDFHKDVRADITDGIKAPAGAYVYRTSLRVDGGDVVSSGVAGGSATPTLTLIPSVGEGLWPTAPWCPVSSVPPSLAPTAASLTAATVPPTSLTAAASLLWLLRLSGNCSPLPAWAAPPLLVWHRVRVSMIPALVLASCPVRTRLWPSAKCAGSFPIPHPSVRMLSCSPVVWWNPRFSPLPALPDLACQQVQRTPLSGGVFFCLYFLFLTKFLQYLAHSAVRVDKAYRIYPLIWTIGSFQTLN
jgi:hypothetical protein